MEIKEFYLEKDFDEKQAKRLAFGGYIVCSFVFFLVLIAAIWFATYEKYDVAKITPVVLVWCISQAVVINYFSKAKDIPKHVRTSFSGYPEFLVDKMPKM